MQATTKIKCAACESDTLIGFKFPAFLETSQTKFECGGCKSVFLAFVKRKKGDGPAKKIETKIGTKRQKQITVTTKLIVASPVYLEIVKEQEAERKALANVIEDNAS